MGVKFSIFYECNRFWEKASFVRNIKIALSKALGEKPTVWRGHASSRKISRGDAKVQMFDGSICCRSDRLGGGARIVRVRVTEKETAKEASTSTGIARQNR